MSQSNGKVQLDHLQRQVYIYIRQSTLRQVHQNQESQRRQYALQERAVALGWPRTAVVIVDEDQGISGRSQERPGFRRLTKATARGEVGAICCLEVSRLSRLGSAWQVLLELCTWHDTLFIDEEGVYDPNLSNDQLVLGIRALVGVNELATLHLRMQMSREAKAQRGELRFHPPSGLVHDCQGKLRLDADEEVQGAIRLLFAQFRSLGSAAAVVRHFRSHNLSFPTRQFGGVRDGEVEWKPLTYGRVLQVLHNPLYAGVYAYGRRAYSRQRKPRKKRDQREVKVPQEEWIGLIGDAFPGYIEREEYEANQRRLAKNRPGQAGSGASRSGRALLGGRVLCGRCGRPMQVVYSGTGGRYGAYICRPRRQEGQNDVCQRVSVAGVDQRVATNILEALIPAEIELSLQVVEEVARQRETLRQQWERRLERSRYEADVARRRYRQVEPENRLVARTLEREWEGQLATLSQVEQEYAAMHKKTPLTLSAEEREQLQALACDLPALWEAESTTTAERKEIVRLLVADVTLTRQDTEVLVQLRWVTNMVEKWTVSLPQRGKRTDPAVLERIRDLAPTHTDAEIATQLNEAGVRTAQNSVFTATRVSGLRRTYKIRKVQRA